MNTLLPRVELESAPHPTAAVIWLHGLGADGHDFAGLVPELDLSNCPPIRFVFPHAPRPCSQITAAVGCGADSSSTRGNRVFMVSDGSYWP